MTKTKLRPCQNRDEAAEWVGRKVVHFELGNVFLVTQATEKHLRVGADFYSFDTAALRFNIGVEVPIEIEWRDCTIADIANGPVHGRYKRDATDSWLEGKIFGFSWEFSYKYLSESEAWKYAQVPVESEAAK